MEKNKHTMITIEAAIQASPEKVWEYFTKPEHITKWNNASDDWHTPKAENDLREGGQFAYRMEAKDGSFGFDFGGTYDVIKPLKQIDYTLGDGRKVQIDFFGDKDNTQMTENFEAEATNSVEMQKTGWQAILDNLKKYTEAN